jgi:predicted DNA-binding transcriptional regulator AlpA
MNQYTYFEQDSIDRSDKSRLNLVRGLSRNHAANYIGISSSLFDQLIKEGSLPKPIRSKSRTIWDIRQIDEAFDDLGNCDDNPWDDKH